MKIIDLVQVCAVVGLSFILILLLGISLFSALV